MLNFLSAKCRKESALIFLSIFSISGLGSLKAQGLNNYAPQGYRKERPIRNIDNRPHTFASENYSELRSKSAPALTEDQMQDPELESSKTDETPLDDREVKTNNLQTGNFKKPMIGGPSQPEMGSFKSVGADNMADPFTGDFSYNVPLLDVGGYPVNMFYNSGITMDQDASWVGLGWNINPGTIMRNMRGIPDDFNGTDKIIKRQSIRPDKTWGVSAGAGLKFAGFPIVGLGVDVNAGLSFNNKLGVALEAGIHPSLSLSTRAQDDKTASLSFGANLSASSRNGASVTPSVNVSLTNALSQSESRTGSIGVSFTQTSRSGITGLHLDAGLSKSKNWYGYSNSSFYKLKSLSGTEAALSSNISFAYPTIQPSIRTIFTRRSYNLSFSVGGEIFGLNGHGRLAGYYTESWIQNKDKETSNPAYGMLHYQKANNDINALLDFNRANDGVYTPGSPAMAIPIYTYDIFSINGEGVGGSFRATRNDLGYMRDGHVKSRDDAASLGLDLGFGNTVHGGAEFSYAHTPSEVGGWNKNNLAKNVFQFKDLNKADPAVYFKNPGEKAIPDEAYQNSIGGEELVRLKLGSSFSVTPALLPKLLRYDANKNLIGENVLTNSSVIKNGRDKRTQVISFLTAYEAARIGFDRKIYSYDPDNSKVIFGAACDKTGIESIERSVPQAFAQKGDRKEHHISEIDVLGTDGRKYVYGLPVYNTQQVDVSFSIDNGDKTTGKSRYKVGEDDGINNAKGRDWFMNQEETPAYTHSFLLTALVSPNYVDITGDGITEDDMGDAVKFNYSRFNQGFNWRTPVGDYHLSDNTSTAAYSEGLKTDDKDDKAHYVYGTREMWHLYSIESKNMVARFYVQNDRKDSRQVLGQKDGIDENWGMQRLEKICLYSKGDLTKLGNQAKPIKTVRFFQSYKLCQNVENSKAGFGKLTLDSIWITYNGIKNKPKSRYVFYYPSDKNPAYEYNGNDRWGNYKPASNAVNGNPEGLSNADYPYVKQNKEMADKNAASWVMNKILLPSGGLINIDFESDDYAYVQDRKAANMFEIEGFGDKYNPNTTNNEQKNKFLYPLAGIGPDYNYVYVKLSTPIIRSTVEEEKRELIARYFENTKQLYLKLAVMMPPSPGLEGSELIPVYADIDQVSPQNIGIVPGSAGKTAYIKIAPITGTSSPMVQQALQFLKQQLPGKAYPGYDVSENSTAKGVVIALAGMITSVASLAMGEDAVLRRDSKCREAVLAQSFVRLTNPTLTKYGGGLRVKKVTINDNWNQMTGQYEASYGQEYKYTTKELINGQLTTISSGVASWEPSMGSDENPHKEIMRYLNHNKGGPYDFGATEMPLGEMFYPSPMIGYSRVEVLSIHRDTVKNLPTRQVTEFYTNKDFPFRSTCTQLSDPEANVPITPSPLKQLLRLDMQKYVTQSQGFLVDMNDMNGKIKFQATYSALDDVNPVSITQNFYNVKKATDKTYKFNHVLPTIAGPEGNVSNTIIGRDIELMADFRQHNTETITTNISVNFDFFFLGIFPVPLTNLLQPTVYEGTTYRSASLLKIVNHYGILDSVVVITKESMVSTKNLVYDAETGNPLITKTNNLHDKPVYNFSYPAHWAYSGMGPAYKNIDATYPRVTFRHGKLETNADIDMSLFESGDEIYVMGKNNLGPFKNNVCDGPVPGWLPKNYENRIWALSTGKGGSTNPQMIFIDRYGNPYTAADVYMRIVRSGHRNMLDQTVGTITSLEYPVNSLTNKLEFTDSKKIIQTTAATFKDHWRVDNSFYQKDEVEEVQTPLQVHHLTFTPSKNLSLFDSHCDGSGDHQVRPFFNPAYFNSEYQSFGKSCFLGACNTKSMRFGQSWAMYDFSAIPADADILKASLSLKAHKEFVSPTTIVHSQAIACNVTIGHSQNAVHQEPTRNNFYITRAKKDWNNSFNDANWFDFFYNTSFIDSKNIINAGPTNSSYASYVCDYSKDNRPDITLMVRQMITEKNQYPTGIKLSEKMSIPTDFSDWNKQKDASSVCFEPPSIDIYYTSCSDASAPAAKSVVTPAASISGCNTSFPQRYCTTTEHHFVCLSKFTKKAINPYVEGILGNWRIDTSFVYYGDRKEGTVSGPLDTRTAGTIVSFKEFWNLSANYLQRNSTSSNVWTWNSSITQYNRKGYEIENKDPLDRFNAGLYGYNQQLPVAVANNSRVREVMFDGFEDYDYQTAANCISCKPHRHSNFEGIENNIVATQKHTGNYSLRVVGPSIVLKAPITDTATANRGYGLRIRMDSVYVPSSELTNTANGTGLQAKYYNHSVSNQPLDPGGSGSSLVLTRSNQAPYIAVTDKEVGPNVHVDYFSVKWEGKIQVPMTGTYLLKGYSDNGFRIKIDGVQKTNNNAWTRYDVLNQATSVPLVWSIGETHTIEIDFYEAWGLQSFDLFWSINGATDDRIPMASLYMPTATTFNTLKPGTWCTRADSIQVRGNALTDTFALLQSKKMLLSAWVKEDGNDCKCSSYVKNNITLSYLNNSETKTFIPTGNIIEGWQRYESIFTVPGTATGIVVSLNNLNGEGGPAVFFDDIRIQPFNANMKSFVYHSSNLRLMAELDENNYASFYEYDDDGTLTRVKKETINGIKTITETRSAMQKTIQ